MQDYQTAALATSELFTKHYSTSFSLGIRYFDPALRPAIYSIYGFVRIADEIVDSFVGQPQAELLAEFITETNRALKRGLSTNPLIDSYVRVAHQYHFEPELTKAFFASMQSDLINTRHDTASYDTYIYGSAEVVGLMCLAVFVDGDEAEYNRLKPAAQALGAVFQKVNFLRDFASDQADLGRSYFPSLKSGELTNDRRDEIIADISADLVIAERGLAALPKSARYGVELSTALFKRLITRLAQTDASVISSKRVRVPDYEKAQIAAHILLRQRLGL